MPVTDCIGIIIIKKEDQACENKGNARRQHIIYASNALKLEAETVSFYLIGRKKRELGGKT
jgi:hypothetical protein